ncbi:unnamed protein product [Amaranthus hypochondriacus]
MTSSTITGDRRWAPARRGGMTVLGKVAVPKPINLPSQRLENHGLDPNVEIVPKGTLSWGSRPSSSGSNAWGTSALSPTTDGSSSSPSHLVGRPSSSGGTRPSTSGSEKAHDSKVGAWGSNSRPSSASGILASNHSSSTSLRPRSAETRPGSSHLSRFAEPAPGVWGGTAAQERKGVASSGADGFSLSSGDFPTLGSEKDESKKNLDPLEHASHGRPGSSSGVRTMDDSRGNNHGDDIYKIPDARGNSWRKDDPPFVEDGPRPSMERWHGEHHMYPNPNMAPHYESWRGAPPVNPSGAGLYRGPPCPPYGGPVPPGGFHLDPFPYYPPHVPAPGLASSQPIPPGVNHHGHQSHHSKNADMQQMPHVPHFHPGMPMQPGFYPGPVPYNGYYRPPLGFCNPNEREMSFMGMPAGPPVYTRYANQNAPDLNNAHPRSQESRGPENVEPGHPHDPRGHHKVLMNPSDGWNQNEEEKWGHRVTASPLNSEKGILSRAPQQGNAWDDDYKKDEDIYHGKTAALERSSHSSDSNLSSIEPSSVKLPDRLRKTDEAKIDPALDIVVSPRDNSLIQKIEGLNAKTRAAGGKQDGFRREEPNDRVQIANVNDHGSAYEANSDVVLERHYPSGVLVPVSRGSDVSAVDGSHESAVASITAATRRSVRGIHSRGDPHAKGRFHGQEVGGWGKNFESKPVLEAGSRSVANNLVEEHDPSDMQRAKMREIAKQRAIQLQKEEEERVREQKAKALAKLEELNRRSANLGMDNAINKETNPLPGDVRKKQDVSRIQPAPSVDANHSIGSSAASNNSDQINEISTSKTSDPDVSPKRSLPDTKGNAYQEDSLSSQSQLPTTDTNVGDDACHKPAPQFREVSKQKRGGYKQKQNVPSEKNSVQDSILDGKTDLLKDFKVSGSTQEGTSSSVDSRVGKMQSDSPVTAEVPVQKKKANKSGKNRHKVEESSTAVSSSITMPKDNKRAQAVPEITEQNASSLHANSTSMQSSVDPKGSAHTSENQSSFSSEDTHGRVNSSWKAQHSRKPRNSQANRASEKNHINDTAIWAPVRAHNKPEVAAQTNQNSTEILVSSATGDSLVHYSSKSKRAEMERYVPKPVAKEMAQQGSIPLLSSIDPGATEGSDGTEKASHATDYVMKAEASLESKHMDGKNRSHRGQGSWRQRASAESTLVQVSRDSSAANTGKIIQTSDRYPPNSGSDNYFEKRPPSRLDELSEKVPQASLSDGWESMNDLSSNSVFTGVKDHTPSGKGRRHPIKGQRGNGRNHDHKEGYTGLIDLQFSHVEANHAEKTMSSKEIRAAGDRSIPHWQPKSHGHVKHNQQENRSQSGQNFTTEDTKALKSETGQNDSSDTRSLRNQSAPKDPVLASEDKVTRQAIPNAGFQEARRDKRVAPAKGRPPSPSWELEPSGGDVDPISFGTIDGRNEQNPSSGNRKNANQSSRFNRGHESRGDWSSTAHENKQHYSSTNREKQRQNSHYQYQPVGSNSSGRSNESSVQAESQSGASRFRERGQNQSRRGRGNFNGRQAVLND